MTQVRSRLYGRICLTALSLALVWFAGDTSAQQVLSPNGEGVARLPSAAPRAAPPAPRPAFYTAPPVARTEIVIPEGTEVRVRLNDKLSSATNVEGDEFSITTDEPIELSDGTIIPAGFRGKGEVTEAHKKGMLGKAGELHIRLDYVRIGDTRLHLRAEKGGEGKSGVGTTVVLTLLVTPLFLMHHGAELVYPHGMKITAFVDQDTKIPLPLASPPQVD